ncbi:MAG: BtpA/SgcQ family protein [Chloroflexota bacterium]|nr:BtpA/SgcQ family protein [Chloroflexota bacterium]MDE2855025.1 BtpA/SgcQ family protein [Chloroflexota bacterium]MDE2946297.1 BtpA/SgcQ family protein [Chloroflexota bacterium]
MTSWLQEMFHVEKPVIGMCHLLALPGDPDYDSARGMPAVVADARANLRALQEGGVDGVMFSNEFSLPYLTKVESATVAAMSRVIAELYDEIRIPFGVNVLWDPYASLDLAVATGAQFLREIFTGVYASDFGLWDTNCGAIVRHQHRLGGKDIKLFFNILPEAAAYLANRDIVSVARSTVFNTGPDALCISGLTAGEETSAATLRLVKDALRDMPVVANTGVNHANVSEQLSIADAAIIGTAFKRDGEFENPVDAARVSALMNEVENLR